MAIFSQKMKDFSFETSYFNLWWAPPKPPWEVSQINLQNPTSQLSNAPKITLICFTVHFIVCINVQCSKNGIFLVDRWYFELQNHVPSSFFGQKTARALQIKIQSVQIIKKFWFLILENIQSDTFQMNYILGRGAQGGLTIRWNAKSETKNPPFFI